MIQTSMTIYSGLVTKNATPMKPEELRAAAKAAISSAPYFLEAFGLVTITDQPAIEPAN